MCWTDDEETADEWECVFPGECCMPGLHTSHECHTAEMIAAYFREQGDDHGG